MRCIPVALLLFVPCALGQVPPQDGGATAPQGGVSDPNKATPADNGPKWVTESTRSLEVPIGATDVVGKFAFVNPSDATVEFREMNASCACTSSTIRIGERTFVLIPKPKSLLQVVTTPEGEKRVPVASISVGPRESGEFELHLDMSGSTSKSVSLDVHTTDPASPMLHLTINALGQRVLIVEPEEVDLGIVEPRAKREFSVRVHSKVTKDFNIENNADLPPNVTATWEKTMVDGAATWTLHGVYTASDKRVAGAPEMDAVGVKFATDLSTEKQIVLRVVAKIGRPVEVAPSFLSLGQLRQGKARTESLRLHRTDGATLAVTSVKFENLSLPQQFVTATIKQDGAATTVEITIAENAPRGLLRGDIVIELDHPQVTEQRVLFNGFIR